VVKILDEHERTMAFAQVALGQISSLRQNATPRNYEIWYVYATGYNPPLNKVINETLARSGKLTDADLEQMYGISRRSRPPTASTRSARASSARSTTS
jgi:diguanylate cyclase